MKQTNDPQFPIVVDMMVNGIIYSIPLHWSEVLRLQESTKRTNETKE